MTDTGAMDRNLALETVRVTEAAALAASRQMGRGNERAADQAAVNAMRDSLNGLSIAGIVVIGEGPELRSLRARAPANVQLPGYQSFHVLRSYLERAAAFVYAAREDFGIVLAEAQAAGCPVIAFGRGGAAEIVGDSHSGRPRGVLFEEQTPAAVVDAVATFERRRRHITPAECRAGALRFGVERFRREFFEHVMTQWEDFKNGKSRRPPVTSLRVA